MATAHLSAQVFSRGGGHSAVGAAAYRARISLTDERTGETHDYTRHRAKCLFEGIYAPKGAPEWAYDRAQLWNHVEAFEKHRRAELAREVNIALPSELTPEQNRYALQDWIKENVTRKGLIADAVIHQPNPTGDSRNIHAHVMIVMRPLDGSEFLKAKPRFDTFSEKQAAKVENLMAMRQSWEKIANRHLERHGHEARIDMGRLENAGPTVHLGKHATAMERRGVESDRGDVQREAANQNEARAELTALEAQVKRDQAAAQERQRAEALAAERTRQAEQAQMMARAAALAREAQVRTAERVEQQARPVFRAFPDQAPQMDQAHGPARDRAAARDGQLPEPQKSPEQMRREMADRFREPQPRNPQTWPERGKAPDWKQDRDGFEGLTHQQQERAEAAFERWQERRGGDAGGFTLGRYVEYVQEQAAKREAEQVRQAPQEAARRPQQDRLARRGPKAFRSTQPPETDRSGLLREAVQRGRAMLTGLAQRLESAFERVTERHQSRSVTQPTNTQHDRAARLRMTDAEAARLQLQKAEAAQPLQPSQEAKPMPKRRSVADEILQDAREAKRAAELSESIEDVLKKSNENPGLDVNERLRELRRQRYDITGR